VRIGLLSTSFPRRDGDVAGAFVLGFARTLAERGHRLEVLVPEPAAAIAAPSWPGIQVHFVPYIRPRAAARTFYGAGVPDNLRHDPLAWLGLAPFGGALLSAVLRRRSRWDAVISHFGLPCGLIAGLSRQHRPHICVLHSADMHLLCRLPARGAIAKRIATGASQLWFVSTEHRERFMSLLAPADARRATAIAITQPMGVPAPAPAVAARPALRAELGMTDFTLLTIGRLVPVKGLTEAMSTLRHRADLQWLIAGDGPDHSRLGALARAARIRVELLGTVTGPRKHALLQAADAFVLPSRRLASGRSEGVPTSVIEAMSHGLPVLASHAGGTGEVVRHLDTGLLYDPQDPHALQAGVDTLIADANLRETLARRGRLESARHLWSALAPEMERMLRVP
jgi:glycosyltransferase involved in cell wall biosynthesis